MKQKAQERYRDKHRQKNTCISCFRPAVKSGLCKMHYEDHAKDSREWYQRTKGKGKTRCGNCGLTGHNRRACPNPPFALLPENAIDMPAQEFFRKFAGMIPQDISVRDLIVLLGKLSEKGHEEK